MTTVNGVAHFIGKESSKKVKDVPETNNNVVPLTQEKV